MLSANSSWTLTAASASFAVGTAAAGLGLEAVAPAAPAILGAGLLTTSLGFTALAFTLVAQRVRRLEAENEGLVEEISQEFDRVKDKLEIFSEALAEPRSLTPEEVENTPTRRVMVK